MLARKRKAIKNTGFQFMMHHSLNAFIASYDLRRKLCLKFKAGIFPYTILYWVCARYQRIGFEIDHIIAFLARVLTHARRGIMPLCPSNKKTCGKIFGIELSRRKCLLVH
jgi:hypothetical protein